MHTEDMVVVGVSGESLDPSLLNVKENQGASELDSSVDPEPGQKKGDRSDSSIMF